MEGFVVITWSISLFFFEVGEHGELGVLEKLQDAKVFSKGPLYGEQVEDTRRNKPIMLA